MTSDENTANTVIEAALELLFEAASKIPFGVNVTERQRIMLRALYEKGLLADPADRERHEDIRDRVIKAHREAVTRAERAEAEVARHWKAAEADEEVKTALAAENAEPCGEIVRDPAAHTCIVITKEHQP